MLRQESELEGEEFELDKQLLGERKINQGIDFSKPLFFSFLFLVLLKYSFLKASSTTVMVLM